MTDLMGELRAALHEPSLKSWQRITTLLEDWQDRDQLVEEAIPYAHSLISRWSTDIPRPMPVYWAQGFHNEGPVWPELFPLVSLASEIKPVSLYVSRYKEVISYVTPPEGGCALPLLAHTFWLRAPTTRAHLAWLFASDAPRLKSFTIEDRQLDASLARKLRDASWFGEKIEHLRLAIPDDSMIAALMDVKLTGVKVVDISEARDIFEPVGIYALLEALSGAKIERFDCNSYSLDDEILEVIGDHETLKHIDHLDIRYQFTNLHRPSIDAFLESPNLQPHTKQSIQEYYDDIFE